MKAKKLRPHDTELKELFELMGDYVRLRYGLQFAVDDDKTYLMMSLSPSPNWPLSGGALWEGPDQINLAIDQYHTECYHPEPERALAEVLIVLDVAAQFGVYRSWSWYGLGRYQIPRDADEQIEIHARRGWMLVVPPCPEVLLDTHDALQRIGSPASARAEQLMREERNRALEYPLRSAT